VKEIVEGSDQAAAEPDADDADAGMDQFLVDLSEALLGFAAGPSNELALQVRVLASWRASERASERAGGFGVSREGGFARSLALRTR
jgi:hypothetical protein